MLVYPSPEVRKDTAILGSSAAQEATIIGACVGNTNSCFGPGFKLLFEAVVEEEEPLGERE